MCQKYGNTLKKSVNFPNNITQNIFISLRRKVSYFFIRILNSLETNYVEVEDRLMIFLDIISLPNIHQSNLKQTNSSKKNT